MGSSTLGNVSRQNLAKYSIAGSMALGLAACGGDDSGGDRDSVLVWHSATAVAGEKLGELVDRYNSESPTVPIKLQYIGMDGFSARLVQAIANNEAPDLVLGDSQPSVLGNAIATDRIVDLNQLFGTGPYPLQGEDIYEGMLTSGVYDGTTYAVPTDGGNYAFIYNRSHFEEAGIQSPPTTWDELTQVASSLTDGDRYGVYLPIGSNEWPVYTWQSMLWSAGGEFLSEDNSDVLFNSPEGVLALRTWTDMVESGLAYPSSAADSNQNQGVPAFTAEQYSMFIGGAYNLPAAFESLGEENVGVFPFPVLEEPAMNTGTNISYIVDNTDAGIEGAYEFLSWFMQPENQAEWDMATDFLPTHTETTSTAEYQEYLAENPHIEVFVQQQEYASTRPSIMEYSEISSALGEQLERAMLLQASPEEALEEAAAAAQDALA